MKVAFCFCTAIDTVPIRAFHSLTKPCQQHVFQHVSQLSEAGMYKTSCRFQIRLLMLQTGGKENKMTPCIIGRHDGNRLTSLNVARGHELMNAGHAGLESNRVQHQHAEAVPIQSRHASAGSQHMPESRSARHMAATWPSHLYPHVSGYVMLQSHTNLSV